MSATATGSGTGDTSRLMWELIESCYSAQVNFQSAARAVGDRTTRRLFEIYAQQRTRFAEELRRHAELQIRPGNGGRAPGGQRCLTGDWARTCLDIESKTLDLYKQAVANRTLPTRTHFVVASQLALMERAHDRVSSLLGGMGPAGGHAMAQAA